MTQALFFDAQYDITKLSSETSLPDDPNQWSDEVLQELAKQVPYLADFDTHVVMETVDGERGYGMGQVEVTNKSEAPMTSAPEQMVSAGIRSARIPVIIRDNKLQPFDVVITEDGRALPLTESRLRQALFRPQNFDVTSKTPGDQSMIGQLYPPYRQNNGFGGGATGGGGSVGKTASASGYFEKTASPLEGVLELANVSDMADFRAAMRDGQTKRAFAENEATHASVLRIGQAVPQTLEKRAHTIMQNTRPSVLQVAKAPMGYVLKVASHHAWSPVFEHINRGELVRRCGEKIALATDMAGSTTMAGEPGVSEEGMQDPSALQAAPVDQPGMYEVQTDDGESLSGSVIPNLLDVDGKPLPIALFTDGQHVAVQSDVSGTHIGDFSPPGMVSASEASGHGVFFTDMNGPIASLPLELGMSIQGPGTDDAARFQATTFDGRQVQVSIQPYVQSIQNVDGVMLVPDSWMWIPLDNAEEVGLAEHAGGEAKTANVARAFTTVQVRGGGANSFNIYGLPVEKLAQDQTTFLSQDDALFLLVGLGADATYAQKKLAAASTGYRPETVRVSHLLKTAEEVRGESMVRAQDYLAHVPVHRHRMWKEAAMLPDPTAVDAVLSLGFINPENIATFVGYLPSLDEAQRRMCELLIAARLGMRELSEGSLERAIRAMEDVIQGLRLIAFQG